MKAGPLNLIGKFWSEFSRHNIKIHGQWTHGLNNFIDEKKSV
jgi:hypothetical protein